ncbi:hypothetical protein PYW07_015216 [Mythimna separata]|uniref:Serpin domain-containing protein n=1 Tax=Mythimna separata TaxID=271217 RepID=A0AAD8DZL5_MYTSE|nr:hypothetical protein PYW07_015216 [Mythimna separata]
MWKLLPVLAVLAKLILTVTCARDTHTIITVKNKAEAASLAAVEGGNGTAAAAGAAAAASSTTIIKTHHHHKKCAANERYVKCPEKLCQPQVCDQVGVPQCSAEEEQDKDNDKQCTGPAACVCKVNYVRNDEGICIPAKDCPNINNKAETSSTEGTPGNGEGEDTDSTTEQGDEVEEDSCAGDSNAKSGCDENCTKRCPGPKPAECKCEGCECKDGFVYDPETRKCVSPEQCSMTTTKADSGSSEEPSSSIAGSDSTTEESGSKTTTKPSEMETTTEEFEMDTTTHKPKNKKRKTTTTESSGGQDSSTEWSESNTGDSGMDKTTHKPKKHKTTTTESSGGQDSSTEWSESNTGDSEMDKTTHKPKKHKTTTTETSDGHSSSTKESEMTTNGYTETEKTTEESESGGTTGDSGMEKKTHKRKKHKTSTTASSGEESEMTTEGPESETTTACTETEKTTEESESEGTTEDSGMEKKTHKRKKHKTSTTASSGEESEMTTEGSESETTTACSETEMTTGGSGSGGTTEGSEMEKTTHKRKKHKTTTTASSGEESEMTTEGSKSETTTACSEMEMTTRGSESEGTTEDSGMEKKTHRRKKHKTSKTASSGEESEMTTDGPESETTTACSETEMTTRGSGSEGTTEDSGIEKTTHRRKKHNTTTTASSGEESEMTTDGPESETTTDCSEGTTEGSGMEKTTRRHKKRKSTTTESSGEQGSTTEGPSTTGGSEMETTTKDSDIHKTTEEGTNSTHESGHTSTDSSMTTTDGQMTTKGPKDCNRKNEWYFICAPPCPQRTCEEYLNGAKCPVTTKVTCTPECRCLIGYYKDEEGNCLSTWECRRKLRPTPTAMTSTTGNPDNQETKTSSSTTMMSTTPPPNCEDVAYELFVTGNLAYTTKLLAGMIEHNPGNSVLVGGASILFLFAQLVLEAKGTAKTEILNVVNLKDTEQVRCFFPKISAELTASYSDIQFSLFCKIYADSDYALTADYIQRTSQIFGMGPENLDFSSPTAAQKINTDVAEFTNNVFERFIKPITLSPLDGMVLVDAEDFQGKWEKQFNPLYTINRDFFKQGRIERVPTMYGKGWYLYTESSALDAKVLKLNYVGGKFSLAIILPNMLDGITDLIRRMKNPENVKSTFDSLKYEYVECYLPTFNISVANRLKMSTEVAEIKESFSNTTTGFEDIGSAKLPYVSDILQRINYQVNEYGMGDKYEPDFSPHIPHTSKVVTPRIFRADHPFVYMLSFKKIVVQAGYCA